MKLIILIVLVTALVLGVFVAIRATILERQQAAELQQRAELIAERIAAAMSPSIWNFRKIN